jgi:EmrB/QacA subfamily drug resistance transporter
MSRSRTAVLIICSTSLFVVGLDVSIVNVALPSIGRDLATSVSGLQWTIDAYTLSFAGLLMFAGSTADRVGRKRVFLVGLVVFTGASVLCSVAPSLGTFVAFRALQGVGASMLSPVALSIVANTFTEARERAQAIGIWAAVFGVSTALGPVVGGLLVDGLGWRSIFWLNLPVGAAAVGLTLRFVPESRAAEPRRADPVGQALVVSTLVALVFGLIESSEVALVLGAAALAGFVLWERRRDEPLLDLGFFRSASFSGSATIAVAAFAALGGFLFLNTLYLQDARGLSPLHAGLYTLPMAAMAAALPPICGRIVGARGARLPLVVAGTGMTAGCVLRTSVDATTPLWQLFGAYVAFGIGFGFVNAPITNAAVSELPRSEAGLAGAVVSTARQVGQALGVAVVGALAAGSGWLVLAGCGAIVLVLGLAVTTRRPAPVAARSLAG